MNRKILYVLLAVVLVASLVGCAAKTTTTTATTGGKIKVGLSFSDFATERWPIETGPDDPTASEEWLRSDRSGSRP